MEWSSNEFLFNIPIRPLSRGSALPIPFLGALLEGRLQEFAGDLLPGAGQGRPGLPQVGEGVATTTQSEQGPAHVPLKLWIARIPIEGAGEADPGLLPSFLQEQDHPQVVLVLGIRGVGLNGRAKGGFGLRKVSLPLMEHPFCAMLKGSI